MGNRSVSISMAAAIAVMSAANEASAQSAAPTAGAGQSAAINAAAAMADKDAAALAGAQRARLQSSKGPEGRANDVKLEDRPPVRREVSPQVRDARRPVQPRENQKTAGEPASQPTAGSAAAVTSQVAPNASAAPAGRKAWPVVVGTSAAPSGSGSGSGSAAHQGGEADAQSDQQPRNLHTWSQAEIEKAKAHCTAALKGVDVGMLPEDPIKQGECGSPVLFRVMSIGRSPAVELSPPVLLTCDMIASLDRWIKREVQPQARTHLGGSVVRIDTMSSYSCRNAYGRTKSRLSEHGKANAIDVSGFTTAKDTTTVLASWGPTLREQRAIAASQEAERAAAAANAARGAGTANAVAPSSGGGSAPIPAIPGVIISSPGSGYPAGGPALGYAPSRLGGPRPANPQKPVAGDTPARQQFLKEIHTSACKYFGTVLGPEANNAHRNHFHLDMADRPRGNFCQ